LGYFTVIKFASVFPVKESLTDGHLGQLKSVGPIQYRYEIAVELLIVLVRAVPYQVFQDTWLS